MKRGQLLWCFTPALLSSCFNSESESESESKMNPLKVWKWNNKNAAVTRYCHKEGKACVWWVRKYLKDCLCNASDHISFGLGLISLLAWAVAEIPQIITNFRTKSSHGVSILFLLTWVFGDIFNLLGCLLEPATLYTISTVVLLLQSLYYDHLYCPTGKLLHSITKQDDEDEHKRPLNPKDDDDDNYNDTAEDGIRGGGIPIPPRSRARTGDRVDTTYYFTSARSMAGSSTPPFRSTYLSSSSNSNSNSNSRRVVKSGPSTLALHHHHHHSSSEDEAADAQTSSFPSTPAHAPRTKPVSIPRSAARGVMVAASVNLPFHTNAMPTVYKGRLTGRKLLQDASEHSAFGQWLGWMMAAIYMGGRFPQIILNIRRGSIEGLNPLMFIFALVANISYVASILVRSTEWKRIKANMPWLLDAVVCVALDLFIILQYVYYSHIRKKESLDEDEDGYQKDSSTEAHQPKPS